MMVTVLPANSGCCPPTGPVKNGDATRHSATATTNALITLTFPHPPAGSRKDGTVGSQVNVSVLYGCRCRLPLGTDVDKAAAAPWRSLSPPTVGARPPVGGRTLICHKR